MAIHILSFSYFLFVLFRMPIKMGKKTYKTFGTAVAAKQREGYSKESATKIVGSIEAKQHPRRRKRS
jgi:hypothetical protein